MQEKVRTGRITNHLKEIREEKGFSQRGLAKASGLSRMTIINIENETHPPSLLSVLRLAETLGVSMHELVEEE